MGSRLLRNLARGFELSLGALVLAATVAQARPMVRRTARATAARGFNLFAGAVNVVMNVNRVQCNINNIGETCVDPTNSPIIGGGFWPKGSPNQYIFNAGLQVAGIIAGGGTGADTPGFPWPGDTVGAFFFDPRGDQTHGEGRTNVFNALNSDDVAEWPSAAFINDTTLFNSALIGRKTVSQQDTWVRMWDGNVNLSTGRQHPMGLLVEQRGLAWNFPTGNQDIIYFLFRFINITARDPARYAGLSRFGYSAQDIADIVAIANEFQDRSEATYNVAIPDTGFSIVNVFAAFGADMDVGNASLNYSTGTLPFAMGIAYKSDFREPNWLFPPDINGAPFSASPGFVGVKYLKSPQNIGIAMFGNTTNSAQFPDSRGVQQLWRRLSANLTPADGTCSVPSPATRHFCFIGQAADDTRFFQSSGPLTLGPGESDVIVVAYLHAAPLASAPAATPGAGLPLSSFSLAPFIGGDMKPGFPTAGDRLVSGQDTVKNFERASGWLTHTADVNANGRIDQNEVVTSPRSLFNKALVAQAVFDNRFLLPFAPEAPEFYVIPGDDQVAVAWRRSDTETLGDPFFAIASNVTSPLYDRNFRQYDVEGYRIWRGRTLAQMEVLISFDYAGTSIIDYTGQFFSLAEYGNRCAPELGVTSSCPTFPHPIPLAGEVQQIPPGGRVVLQSGDVFNVVVDTAVVGGGSGLPSLTDNGVPFAYVDHGVRNGFRYFYAVTAFDVNSVKSGPSSLESPLVTKQVTPRAPSSNNVPAVVVTALLGGDGTELNPNDPFPSIDGDNGTFGGIIPPTNGGSFGFLGSVAEALAPGDYVARVDSVIGGFAEGIGGHPVLHMSLIAGTTVEQVSVDLPSPAFNAQPTVTNGFSVSSPLVSFEPTRSALLGLPASFVAVAKMPVEFTGSITPVSMSPAVTLTQGRFGVPGGAGGQASRYLARSRWFDEGGSEPADPTINFNPSQAHTSGMLTGVTRMWSPMAYRQPTSVVALLFRGYGYAQQSWHPGDFVVTWGSGGSISVRDSTHRADLPFNRTLGAGYGFVTSAAITGAGVTAGDLADGLGSPTTGALSYHALYSIRPVCFPDWWDITCAPLSQTTTLQNLDFDGNGTSDGTGIVLVVNGESFWMEMTSLPASGTKWHLRAVGGAGMTATCTPSLPAGTAFYATPPTDCSGYRFAPTNTVRPPLAPGLQFAIRVTQAFEVAAASGDLSRIHTVPDPYYVTNQLEITSNTKVLRFVNLPDRAIIRIYSTSGILVAIVNHNNPQGGGEAVWNLRNRNNQFVASGVYFYHVETPDGREKIGRFTVVNFAQ